MIYILIVIVGIVGGYVLGLLSHDQVVARFNSVKAKIKKRLWG